MRFKLFSGQSGEHLFTAGFNLVSKVVVCNIQSIISVE